MIELKHGNLLNADTEALVNTVNTEGVMGKGVALQFKKAFPEMYKEYREFCKQGKLSVGKLHIYHYSTLTESKYIINFPTKIKWKDPSRLEYIEKGLDALTREIKKSGIRSIAIPPLGCGFGGLSWKEVFPLIEKAFRDLPDVNVIIYPPQASPDSDSIVNRTSRPEMNTSRARVLKILKEYRVLGYELTLLEVQKLLYFLQTAGEPLRLNFKKQLYGPYADNLRHVLHLFEGHFIKGFGDGRNNPDTIIHLLPEALSEAENVTSAESDKAASERLQKVSRLIEGFESPYGMELLATVHWAISREKITSLEGTVSAVHSWNTRKKNIMKPSHIKIARNRLIEQGWL